MMRKAAHGALSLVLTLFLVFGQIAPAFADYASSAMSVNEVSGTVTVTDAGGKEYKPWKGMQFRSGYTVQTSAASYVRINLDNSIILKLDASSKVEVYKSGSNLEIRLKSGSIYVDVKEKLTTNSCTTVTSNMTAGVHGTKFQVTYNVLEIPGAARSAGGEAYMEQSNATVFEGEVSMTTRADGQSAAVTAYVSAGETGTVTSAQTGASGEGTGTQTTTNVTSATEADVTGSTQAELTQDGDYTVDTGDGGFTLTEAGAAARLAADREREEQISRENAALTQTGNTSSGANEDLVFGNAPSTPSSSSSSSSSRPSRPSTPAVPDKPSTPEPDTPDPGTPEPGTPDPGTPDPGTPDPGTPEPSVPAASYTVTFCYQDGVTADSEVTVNENAAAARPASPTRTGYTFGGWYTDAACTQAYEFSTPVTADLTLYAKWEAERYTVTFNSQGGSAVDSQTVNYNETAASPTAPTRTDYEFLGWYTSSAGTEEYEFSTPVTADLTLYAKWGAVYTLTESGSNIYMSGSGSNTDLGEVKNLLASEDYVIVRNSNGFDGLLVDSTLTVPAGKTLRMEAGLTVGLYSGYTSDYTDRPGTLTVEGTLSIEQGIAMQNTSGTSASEIRIAANGSMGISGTGQQSMYGNMANSGTLTVSSGCELEFSGTATFTNGGTIENNGTITLADCAMTNTGTIENNGQITVQAGSSFTNSGTVTGNEVEEP